MNKKPYNQLVDVFSKIANNKLRHLKDQFMEKLEVSIRPEEAKLSLFDPDQNEVDRLEYLSLLRNDKSTDIDKEYGEGSDGVIEAQTMIGMVRNMFDGIGPHPSIALHPEAYHTACQISDLLAQLEEQMEEL